jgi:hypothetical protein
MDNHDINNRFQHIITELVELFKIISSQQSVSPLSIPLQAAPLLPPIVFCNDNENILIEQNNRVILLGKRQHELLKKLYEVYPNPLSYADFNVWYDSPCPDENLRNLCSRLNKKLEIAALEIKIKNKSNFLFLEII